MQTQSLTLASAEVLHDEVVEEAVQERHHNENAKVLADLGILNLKALHISNYVF
jgi:hypothetical protein